MPVDGFIRHYIGRDELPSCRIIAGHHRCIFHGREIVYDPFHFRQFHPEPANFHQAVPPADKLNVPVQTVTGHVSCAIRRFIFAFLRKRIGHKRFFCLFRPVQIPACHLDPCYPKLSQGAGRHTPPAIVYHVNSRIIHGRADGNIRLVLRHIITGNGNRSFRGSVFIGHNIRMHRLKGYQRFPAYHNVFQFRTVHGQGKLAPYLGRQVRHHNMMLIYNFRQSRQVQLFLFGNDNDAGAHRKGRIHIRQGSVKTIAVVTGYAIFLCRRKITPVPGCIGHEILL